MNKFVELVHTIYYFIFPFSLERLVKKELYGCKTICDVGCGEGGFASRLVSVMDKKAVMLTGCEIHVPYLKMAKESGVHKKLVRCDIRHLPFKEKSFDAVISINSIEHIPKDLSYIDKLESLAKKKIVITTPRGYLSSKDWGVNTQRHVCGYEIEEFARKGYMVHGWESRFFYLLWEKTPPPFNLAWSMISHLLNAFTYNHLRFANALLCSKDLAIGAKNKKGMLR